MIDEAWAQSQWLGLSTALSVFLVNALRSVGIPARVAGV
jgi:hypothetical protein